jgi:hypothetical protein
MYCSVNWFDELEGTTSNKADEQARSELNQAVLQLQHFFLVL